MKQGTVLLIGRPNVGKSTFVNNLIGQKVAITSPKPQTTRFPIQALYEEERGQLVFVDTPGIFDRAHDQLAKKINDLTSHAITDQIDVVMYMVDPTRRRDFEEGKVLGIVRKIDRPKILVINKADLPELPYLAQYEFMKSEFDHVFEISAINKTHLKPLLAKIFELIPEKPESERKVITSNESGYPLLNLDSKIFLAELIREKVFLKMGEEIPYRSTVVVDEVTEKEKNTTYVKARILTTDIRYKKMLIGAGARKIKEMGMMARKEIALATSRKIYLDLTVEVDAHWPELFE